MSESFIPPAYITFTGVDHAGLVDGMRALSALYPVEWGVLIDRAQEGAPLFPAGPVRSQLQRAGLRLSAHICGEAARAIVEGREPGLALDGFSRVQINHGRTGSGEEAIVHSQRFAARHGVRAALQCQGDFPDDQRVDWLYDVSFGTGARPVSWPGIAGQRGFCGFSGGLGPDTVLAVLSALYIGAGAAYWIDMESGVRSGSRFDLAKCAAVCRAVYGPR
jgi:hypothetical protein